MREDSIRVGRFTQKTAWEYHMWYKMNWDPLVLMKH